MKIHFERESIQPKTKSKNKFFSCCYEKKKPKNKKKQKKIVREKYSEKNRDKKNKLQKKPNIAFIKCQQCFFFG